MSRCDIVECPLHKYWARHRIGPRGQINPDILIVAGNPYSNEMRVQESGAAVSALNGQRLTVVTDILHAANVPIEKVAAAYAVSCAPGGNSQSDKKELNAAVRFCREHLKKLVLSRKPKIIVALGAVAAYALTGKRISVTKEHGKCLKSEFGGIPVVVSFDPYAVQMAPAKVEQFVEDIRAAYDIARGYNPHFSREKVDRYNVRILKSKSDIRAAVTEALNYDYVVLDTETNGLDNKIHSNDFQVYSVQFAGFNVGQDTEGVIYYVVPVSHPKAPVQFLPEEVAEEIDRIVTSGKLIAHNAKYDLKVLRRMGCTIYPPAMDTMVMHAALRGESSSSLKRIAYSVTDLGGYEAEVGDYDRLSELDFETLASYGALDLVVTKALFDSLAPDILERIDNSNFGYIVSAMPKIVAAFADMEYTGMPFDAEAHKEVSAPVQGMLEEVEHAIQRRPETKAFIAKGNKLLLTGGPSLAKLLFGPRAEGGMGLAPVSFSEKTGEPSTAKAVLAQLAEEGVEIAKEVLVYRALSKLNSSFCKAYPNFVAERTGRIHPVYWIAKVVTETGDEAGAVTARTSCKDPNLQQIPRRGEIKEGVSKKIIRRVFVPFDGHILAELDQSQIEIRVAAIVSGDERMADIIRSGGDFHRATAAAVYGKPEDEVTDSERSAAKAINFGLLYGMGVPRLAASTGMSLKDAEDFIKRHFEVFPQLVRWREQTVKEASRTGFVETIFGRRRMLKVERGDTEDGHEKRQAVNTPIQGPASDITLIGIASAWEELCRIFGYPKGDVVRTDRPLLLGSIHDSLLMSIPIDLAGDVLMLVKQIMEKPPLLEEMLNHYGVPLRVDIEVGANLENMTEVPADEIETFDYASVLA